MMNFVAFGLLALCSFAAGDVLPIQGTVPDFPQMQGFDGEQAKGQWFGHYYINVGLVNAPIHCWSFIGIPADGGVIIANVTTYLNVTNTDINENITVTPIAGQQAKFQMEELTKGPLTTTMVVLGTDYKTHFVKVDQFQTSAPVQTYMYSVNVYSRSADEMDAASLAKAKALIQNAGITADLIWVPQNCPQPTFLDKVKDFFSW